jgi:hypothetical protein
MADTGYNWDAGWTAIDAAILLDQSGTTEDTSAVIDCDGKAACEISIDADYSNHAKATGGLFVYILRDIDGTSYETEDDEPWGFEMPFLQAGTRRRTFSIDVSQISEFKILLDWDNSTASSQVTVATGKKYATIPVAS